MNCQELFTPHTGRNQMAALLQTQKEQAKLEKLLFRQQRDIQRIQRDLENTKSG